MGSESSENTAPPESAATESDAEIARLDDRWRRAVADLDNVRKRHARELAAERLSERSRVARAWLPIVDNLELAIGHAGDNSDAVLDGVRSVRDQAVQVLAQLGYPRHDEVGVPFDPNEHEVAGLVDRGERPPGTVVEVIRPGYGEGAQQLRPATVVVTGQG